VDISPVAAAATAHRDQFIREAAADRWPAELAAERRRQRLARIWFTPLQPSDEANLAALFGALSARSRYLRYLAPIRKLPVRSLRHLASIDHDHHEAVGAFDGYVLVGCAHYFRSRNDPRSAEISVEVADAYHRIGIGARLLRELADLAAARDVSQFTATAMRENTAVLGLFRHLDWPATSRYQGAQVELRLAPAQA
jgi:ribosomal protein S18 acetylase RimI-like enzyme